MLDHPVTIRQVKSVIKNLKNNQVQGDDPLAKEVIKFSAPIMLPAIAKLFTLVLNTAICPKSRNVADQVPIFKKGDTTDRNNCQGISITGCLSKKS